MSAIWGIRCSCIWSCLTVCFDGFQVFLLLLLSVVQFIILEIFRYCPLEFVCFLWSKLHLLLFLLLCFEMIVSGFYLCSMLCTMFRFHSEELVWLSSCKFLFCFLGIACCFCLVQCIGSWRLFVPCYVHTGCVPKVAKCMRPLLIAGCSNWLDEVGAIFSLTSYQQYVCCKHQKSQDSCLCAGLFRDHATYFQTTFGRPNVAQNLTKMLPKLTNCLNRFLVAVATLPQLPYRPELASNDFLFPRIKAALERCRFDRKLR